MKHKQFYVRFTFIQINMFTVLNENKNNNNKQTNNKLKAFPHFLLHLDRNLCNTNYEHRQWIKSSENPFLFNLFFLNKKIFT